MTGFSEDWTLSASLWLSGFAFGFVAVVLLVLVLGLWA